MKNLIICALISTAISAIFFKPQKVNIENLYPECGVVVDLDYKNNIVTFEVFNGNQFSFYGVEDWDYGDIVGAIMDSKGTGFVYDDIVVKVEYNGWLENGSLPENRK